MSNISLYRNASKNDNNRSVCLQFNYAHHRNPFKGYKRDYWIAHIWSDSRFPQVFLWDVSYSDFLAISYRNSWETILQSVKEWPNWTTTHLSNGAIALVATCTLNQIVWICKFIKEQQLTYRCQVSANRTVIKSKSDTIISKHLGCHFCEHYPFSGDPVWTYIESIHSRFLQDNSTSSWGTILDAGTGSLVLSLYLYLKELHLLDGSVVLTANNG